MFNPYKYSVQYNDYQKESVPKFLTHLRETFPFLWTEVVKRYPKYDTTPNFVGRKAVLKTLSFPITWTTNHDLYPVTWTWDGKVLKTTSPNAYNKTWGDIELDNMELTSIPSDKTVVKVCDNSWINENTIMVD